METKKQKTKNEKID